MLTQIGGYKMVYKYLKKYFGSVRLFFSLLGFSLTAIIVVVSFFGGIELTGQHVGLLTAALAQAVVYVAVETSRKSND